MLFMPLMRGRSGRYVQTMIMNAKPPMGPY